MKSPALTYRPLYSGLGEELAGAFIAQPWPAWIGELKGKSGVYVIRDFAGRALYVGESHTGRLYQTLTRHFQRWTGKTAGPTYSRGGVMLAVRVTPASRAVAV